jgi:serine/threonine protein kinase
MGANMLRSFVGVVVDSRRSEAVVVCPGCGKAWPRDLDVCPDDGTWLNEKTAADHVAYKPPRVDDTISEDDDLALPPSRDLAPGTPCGDYEIETKIGEGAWGAVYRAVHPTIGKHVAIKVMSHRLFDEPEAHKRFVAEARALASIRHPGIVEIFGIGRLRDGRAFLTMQWLEGETLGARLQRGPLPRDQALEILRQIARALDAAHVKNIVHRDLKPENVFLLTIDDELSVKLVDFGLAKATKEQERGVAVTRSGQMVGTPLYMSPEQCRSKGVDHRTDIYALGCLGYEVLCGRVPFVHDNAAELISAHLNDEPPSPHALRPDLAPPIDRMLVRMIAKRPDDRPTLGDVRQTIGSVLRRASQPMQAISVDLESATTADDRAKATKSSLRRWMVIAIAAIVVIALGIFAFSSLSEARRQPPPATAPP